MAVLHALGWGLTVALVLVTLPGTLYLLTMTLAGLRLPKSPVAQAPMRGPIAMVVPAHNEAQGIARTLRNLMALAQADGATQVCVVADNCIDHTADVARQCGARVLERHDTTRRGKGYALDFAFRTLLNEGVEAVVVIDADTEAGAELLPVLRQHLGAGAQAVQTRYTVLDADDSPRTRLAELALMAFNVLRPRGRHVLGWSAGILGNGFALSRTALERVPYTATSVVEDLEYHLRLMEAGIRVHFADGATVRGAMPTGSKGQANQRARWEGGRLRMLRQHGSALFARGVGGQWRLLEPLLDLLLLPLAYHAALLLVLLAMPNAVARITALAGLLVLALHVVAAALVGGLGVSRLAMTLAQVPRYVVWKLFMLRRTVRNASASAAWVRTDRDHHSS